MRLLYSTIRGHCILAAAIVAYVQWIARSTTLCVRAAVSSSSSSSFPGDTLTWDCNRDEFSGLCKNPRLRFDTYYYNLGQPLWMRFCNAEKNHQKGENEPETVCTGFRRPPTTPAPGLMKDVSLVWLSDYKMTKDSVTKGVRSSGFKAQFDLCVRMARFGVETYVALDFPKEFMTTLPNVRTLAQINHTLETFAHERRGKIVVAMPEVNAGKITRMGIFGDESEDVRWVMWILGLARSVQQIKSERMRVAANVHHSLKQFYGLGATPITADIPRAVVEGWDDDASATRPKKRNLVLVDRDAYYVDVERIALIVRESVPDAEFKYLQGMDLDAVRFAYQEAKLTVDAYMLGGEAINFEGALWKCLPMVADQMVGHDDFDLLLPDELKFDPFDARGTAAKIVHALTSYGVLVQKVAGHRRFASRLGDFFDRDAALFFSSANVLFVTAATSFDSVRTVVPWALSVWSLYPTARIEIYVASTHLFEKELEGVLLEMTRHGAWQPSYVKLQQVPGELVEAFGDDVRFLLSPLSDGHRYTVISTPRSVLLGRDLLHAHVRALDAYTIASTYQAGKTCHDDDAARNDAPVVAVVRSEAFWGRVRSILEIRDNGEEKKDLVAAIFSDVVDPANVEAIATLRSLPLDVVAFEGGTRRRGDSANLWVHMTYGWTMSVVNLTRAELAEFASALDPLVRSPLWLSLVSFFPAPLQALTFKFPAESFGATSVSGC
eukprot:g683.t1